MTRENACCRCCWTQTLKHVPSVVSDRAITALTAAAFKVYSAQYFVCPLFCYYCMAIYEIIVLQQQNIRHFLWIWSVIFRSCKFSAHTQQTKYRVLYSLNAVPVNAVIALEMYQMFTISVRTFLSVQCNAWHWTEYKITFVSVRPCVRPCVRKRFSRDFCACRGFSGMRHRMLPIAFFSDRPPLSWQRNLGQNWL